MLELTTVLILVNNQLDTQFFSVYVYFETTCFEQPRAHHQENHCINMTSGMDGTASTSIHTCIPEGHLHRVTMPDVVLVQLIKKEKYAFPLLAVQFIPAYQTVTYIE